MRDAEGAASESLKAAPIFSGCSAEELALISSSLRPVDAPAGTVIFHEGDPGEDLYIVESGQIRVVSDVDTEKVVLPI